MRSIEELGDALRLNQRMIAAIRWLGAPGATTELVARLGGARSPTGLCHVFADAGLPSPGALAKAARRDVLAAWVDHAAPTHHAHAT